MHAECFSLHLQHMDFPTPILCVSSFQFGEKKTDWKTRKLTVWMLKFDSVRRAWRPEGTCRVRLEHCWMYSVKVQVNIVCKVVSWVVYCYFVPFVWLKWTEHHLQRGKIERKFTSPGPPRSHLNLTTRQSKRGERVWISGTWFLHSQSQESQSWQDTFLKFDSPVKTWIRKKRWKVSHHKQTYFLATQEFPFRHKDRKSRHTRTFLLPKPFSQKICSVLLCYWKRKENITLSMFIFAATALSTRILSWAFVILVENWSAGIQFAPFKILQKNQNQ